ncbi:MAG: hypothetical protein JNL03_12115 [Prolixibacteraceae bacterium]|nr:hypothetical protein [Prolixibacteraceae bacterium]
MPSAPESKPVPEEKTPQVKVMRRVGSLFSPSIKDALAGNIAEKKVEAEEKTEEAAYNEYENFSEPFTPEQLMEKWTEYLDQLSDRPNLRSALSNPPEITDGNKLLLRIGNSVQEEDVRLGKQELISWLRKELRNSGIELNTKIERVETERTHYNDSEKLQIMMQKNPELFELKQKFNLDFKD